MTDVWASELELPQHLFVQLVYPSFSTGELFAASAFFANSTRILGTSVTDDVLTLLALYWMHHYKVTLRAKEVLV